MDSIIRAVDPRLPKLVEKRILSLPKVNLLPPTAEWPSFVFLSCHMVFQELRVASRREVEDELYGYAKELKISEKVQDPPTRIDPLKALVRGFESLLKAEQVFVAEYSNAPETSAVGLETVSLRTQFYLDPEGEVVVFSILPPRTKKI
jgi:hypothetical protein